MSGDRPWYAKLTTKISNSFFAILDFPGDKLRAATASFREKNKSVYYHRKLKRVTPIEDCDEDDAVCIYEADQQYIRDKMVDETILNILRQRMVECVMYYSEDRHFKCKKETDDFTTSETNYFAKYGDLGIRSQHATDAFRKQQHRMIWERRNNVSLIDGSPINKQ
ncbi:NDUFB10 [Bugula neritina]|uniref:NADH dehydrogenase [ubiquinone] 1 beta subcomplex subunit 10 n=1 Tax=Bugula neritina TaxID=10212 RepID=A0A7J7JH07_BUGNE|nr:NDUFB10 [Bugula neritina]KAF6040132.1 NDUFB10 [Bugula neritina]